MEENKDHCMTCGIGRERMTEIPWGRFIEGKMLTQCRPCRELEIKKQVEDFQNSDTNTECEHQIICPYCGSAYSPESPEPGDSDEVCGTCENEFILQTEFSVEYSTYKKPINK